MNKKLDLKNTRIYSSTMGDILYALMHVGEEVYLSDDEDFNTFTKGKLIGVRYISDWAYSTYTEYPFVGSSVEDGGLVISKYFILAKDAKFKEEKKLRPFKTLDEFFDKFDFNIGDTVTIKRTNCESEKEYGETILFIGFRFHKYMDYKESKNTAIILGSNSYTFEELMNNYLYYKDGKWHPFGIIE